jgi:hypothetical protein
MHKAQAALQLSSKTQLIALVDTVINANETPQGTIASE